MNRSDNFRIYKDGGRYRAYADGRFLGFTNTYKEAARQVDRYYHRLRKEFSTYRRDAIAAAEDLNYDDMVLEKLYAAKSEAEICRIMTTARKEKFDRDI